MERPGDRRRGMTWGRTQETKRAILDAAAGAFTGHGFANTSVTEIGERAGATIGSLYHHFGGKAEIFVALWDDFIEQKHQRVRDAVSQARQDGEGNSFALFMVGARTYLELAWETRDLVLLFYAGDTPPGFSAVVRRTSTEWVGRNFRHLRIEDDAVNRVINSMLSSLVHTSGKDVAACAEEADARKLIEERIRLLERLRAIYYPDGHQPEASLAPAPLSPPRQAVS
ncbi:MAG TPA: TetR/AcrR family transcriptional regulator [Pseudonocardia sp.]